MSAIRPIGSRPTLIAAVALSLLLASLSLASTALAAAPAADSPRELVGPIPPSILVPPVRTSPPARTRPIPRPPQYDARTTARKRQLPYRMESLRLAIDDLQATYGEAYANGPQFLERWNALNQAIADKRPGVELQFEELRRDAMLANPLLDFERLLVLKRRAGQLGLPTNHQCNTALKQKGYDNELAVLSSVRTGVGLQTVIRPKAGWFVGEVDLHPDADRLLFTMPNGHTWQIHEIGLGGQGLRQVSRESADVDNFDASYLPDGRIVYSSTASFTGVPCWHGRERACCLFSMDASGGNVRQLCFDQDLDLHPTVLDNGQVIYSRWDYSGLLHAYVRPLMVMNPDGTGQRAVYGSNSYYPNSLFFPRGVPGHPNKIVAILAGYHGKNRMGELAVLDISVGWQGETGITHRITHRDEPIVPVALDPLTVQAIPQFLHPYPLDDKYILTALQPGREQPWGIYLVDVFDNVTPVLTDPKFDFFEPIPVIRRSPPRILPDRTDPSRDDAVVILHDIYKGPGLKGVPRGTVKHLRIAAYEFGFPGMAGPDKIGRAGPWEAMRILGNVPVYEDGSAKFRIPARTPITLQALDQDGKAVQLMRTWYTAMPGETAACVGCHETPRDVPLVRNDIATGMRVSEIAPWYGPPRGFDFAREVQPVLDRHCVRCHNGEPRDGQPPLSDLRDERLVSDYVGLPLTRLGATRIDASLPKRYPDRFQALQGMPEPYGNLRTAYTPAYEALIPFIRRVNVEDGVSLLRPGEYHADTSELVEMLQKGHYGVQLDREAWDRLVTWIDLNGPCHGTWSDVGEIPDAADLRREAAESGPEPVAARTASATVAENAPAAIDIPGKQSSPDVQSSPSNLASPSDRSQQLRTVAGLLENAGVAKIDPRQLATRTLDLGEGLTLDLVRVPAGRFIIGDTSGDGAADEWPASIVSIERDFWMGRTEVTNAQLRRFLPEHSSGLFTKRQIEKDGPGIQLDNPQQPALRVSWTEAMAFCRQLSETIGEQVLLPTEAEWEYAARAGTTAAFWYGDSEADFSAYENLADRSIACLYEVTAGVAVLQPIPSAMQTDDLAIGTAEVASYEANPWGLFDMLGNVAEWTRTAYRPYPYQEADGRNASETFRGGEKFVVRGGSYYARPRRSRASARRAYPPWQPVHDVGFRIVIED